MDTTTALANTPYSFPPLKNSDILQCLQELGIDDFHKAELVEPSKHKAKVRQVFVHLLYLCSGKTEEDFQQSPEPSSELTAHPDLHDSNFSEWNFFEALQQLMTVCGYYEFSWRDLHHPDSKRLRNQLSGVLNLAKFRQEQLGVYADMNETRNSLLASLEELNEENSKLVSQHEQSMEDSEVKSKEMQQVIQECEELELEIARNSRLQATTREESDALKKQANELADQLTTAGWALEEAVVEEENLRRQIVSSPDRRRAQVSEKRHQVEQVKNEARKLEQELSDCKGKQVRASALIDDVRNAAKQLDNLSEIFHRKNDLENQLKASRSELADNEKRYSEIQQSTVLADRELNRIQSMTSNSKEQRNLQQKATQDALDAAKAALLQVEKDRRQDMARVQAGEAEVQHLEAMLEQKREEMDASHQEMRDELEKTARMYLDRLEERFRALGTLVINETC